MDYYTVWGNEKKDKHGISEFIMDTATSPG